MGAWGCETNPIPSGSPDPAVRLRLPRGYCRGFRDVRLWGDGSQRGNLLLAFPSGLPVEEPWYLVSNADPALDLVWTYGQRFCCEQLFRDQKSGIFQLESKRSASTALAALPKRDRDRLIAAIDQLRDTPSAGSALKGEFEGLRRLRVGMYRVVYE